MKQFSDNNTAMSELKDEALKRKRQLIDSAGLEFIKDDELLEVTPKSLRLRKRILSKEKRLKQQFRGK